MRYTIEHASDIGGVIRAARKAQNMRQDDAAGSVGVSESFMVKAERGAASVQWGKVFQILEGLGVRVTLDIPDATDALVTGESIKAKHRSAVREFRAAERLAATAVDLNDDATRTTHAAEPMSLLRAAERLLATMPTQKPAKTSVVERARRVVGDASNSTLSNKRKGHGKP